MPETYHARPADLTDFEKICFLMYESSLTYHQHLDWRCPLDLLGEQPYWVLEDDSGEIMSALACPPYPPGYAWISFFAVHWEGSVQHAWHVLCEKALENCPPPGIHTLAAVPTREWFIKFLPEHGFNHTQDILMLEWKDTLPAEKHSNPNAFIRSMTSSDLPGVLILDNDSFPPLWQLSDKNLQAAYKESDYLTVWMQEGQLAGYLIAGKTHEGGHISRLAVSEMFRGSGIGYSLVRNCLSHFLKNKINKVTVNTQNNNHASLALYKSAGFKHRKESVKVFTRKIPPTSKEGMQDIYI
ncbi:MAG: GNAT family N-acetyltransferase [Anaerolineaceae bacterium]|nr:GNAT family N-acetyltransferase [Anaerolineaceae bacterium]